MSKNFTLVKITALTHCICKLHNNCISEREHLCHKQAKLDDFYDAVSRSIIMGLDDRDNVLATETAHGGDHLDDFDCC